MHWQELLVFILDIFLQSGLLTYLFLRYIPNQVHLKARLVVVAVVLSVAEFRAGEFVSLHCNFLF